MREIWVIDRDTKACEVDVVAGGTARPRPGEPSGWGQSPFAGIEMRPAGGGKLRIRLAGDDATREELPPC